MVIVMKLLNFCSCTVSEFTFSVYTVAKYIMTLMYTTFQAVVPYATHEFISIPLSLFSELAFGFNCLERATAV